MNLESMGVRNGWKIDVIELLNGDSCSVRGCVIVLQMHEMIEISKRSTSFLLYCIFKVFQHLTAEKCVHFFILLQQMPKNDAFRIPEKD